MTKLISNIIAYIRKLLFLKGNRPNLFIVGAQKSGTSSIHDWLCLSENVSDGLTKESHFFDKYYSYGYRWYYNYFKSDNKYILDSTPIYMFDKIARNRLLDYLKKEDKIIIILRNPSDRALSHWMHEKKKHREKENLNIDYLKELQNNYTPTKSYITRGLYSKQIEDFEKKLIDKQLLILVFEEFIIDVKQVQNKLENFLNIKIPLKNIHSNSNQDYKKNSEIFDQFFNDEIILLKNKFKELKKYWKK